MNCPVCNNEYKENDVFCKNCGTPFNVRQRAFNTFKPDKLIKPIKTYQYLLLILLYLIPVVNLITYIVLAFKSGINLNIRNFSRAFLIFMIFEILVTISLLLYVYYFSPGIIYIIERLI